MSGEIGVTPPAVGDVLLAAQACGWPAVRGAGVEILAGEQHWRENRIAGRVWTVFMCLLGAILLTY